MRSAEDILSLPPPRADLRVRYGREELQFAEVRFPRRTSAPGVMMIHGGYWRAKYDLAHAGHLCGALAAAGLVAINVEYRRVGNPGGGWPGTFEDVRRAYHYLRQQAKELRLDASRVVVMGHSAGGQLALCLAGHEAQITKAVSLAGVLDLRRAWELHLSHDAVVEFLGGRPEQVPEHYREASPAELSILGEQFILHGLADDVVPVEISREYSARKQQRGEGAHFLGIRDAGHFELIDPRSAAWKTVLDTVQRAVES